MSPENVSTIKVFCRICLGELRAGNVFLIKIHLHSSFGFVLFGARLRVSTRMSDFRLGIGTERWIRAEKWFD